MSDYLLTLPKEVHISLSEFLSPVGMKNLSQSCSRILCVYRPLSWKAPQLHVEAKFMNSRICQVGEKMAGIRVLPERVSKSSTLYSWFCNNEVVKIMVWHNIERSISLSWHQFLQIKMNPTHYSSLRSITFDKPLNDAEIGNLRCSKL